MAVHSGTLKPSGWSTSQNSILNLPCTPPCALPSTRASEGGSPVDEDPIAVNPANPNQLLSGGNDYNCGSLQGFFASSNGGATWNHSCMGLLSGCSGFGDPGVAYSTTGTAWITGIDGCASNWDIIFETSTNNGGTWTAPAIAVKPFFTNGLTDKEWIQIDNTPTSPFVNSVYISVTQFDSSGFNSQITVTHSADGGATWSTTGIGSESIYPAVSQFSDLAVAKDGTVYVTWMTCTANGNAGDCGGTTAALWIASSTDGGKTFTSPMSIGNVNLAPDACFCAFYGSLPNTSERVSEIPAVDVDRSTGTNSGHLYVVEYTWTGTFMKVQVTESSNGGSTWTSPVGVAPSSDTKDQFFPWLTVSNGGVVGVTWLDRRNDAANINYDTFGTFSLTGGASFAPNIQLDLKASDPFHDGFGGGFMGDYTGNHWDQNRLMASWMSTLGGSNTQDAVGGFVL